MGMRVLLVEDEDLIREVLTVGLDDDGFNVDPAATGDEVLKRLDPARKPDVLFTDIRLGDPQRDGWFLGERFREAYPSLPVIYATGYSDVQPRPVLGSVFLRKPYQIAEVVDIIRYLTGGSAPGR